MSSLDVEWWVTLSGTATRCPSSWQGWKTRPWHRLLFGAATSKTWTPPRFAEWTSSPQDSHVSPGPLQGSGRGPMTNGGSGRPSLHFFAEFNRDSCSWRTSAPSFLGEDWDSSSLTWPTSGSMRSGRCYLRERSVLPSNGSEFSSWATPEAHARTFTPRDVDHGIALANQVNLWPTPVAHDDQKSPEAHLAMKARMKGGPRTKPTSLTVVAKMWPTPRAENGIPWNNQAWERPLDQPQNLENAVARWPTATSRDGKGRDAPGRTGGMSLPEFLHSHQDQTNGTSGTPSSNASRVLNPRFVEWLMGLPIGWALPTPLGTINCGCLATVSSPSKPKLPCGSFGSD